VRTYYDRYQGGEHEAVWADLLALGNGVHEEPVYSDAVAVARETMSRARTNIETLIVRLDNIDYRFETARDTPPEVLQKIIEIQRTTAEQLKAQFPGLLDQFSGSNLVFEQLLAGFDKRLAPASTLDERSVYTRAQEWSGSCISELESYLQGSLPLSLRAWYECIQHVSFIGSHPVLNPARQEPPAIAMTSKSQSTLPDPFALMGLPDAVDYESWETDEGYPIAVDEFFKANISRDHRYHMNFRDSRADTIFADWQNDYFVAYLRRVFKWGGFPGWERHPNPPSKLIVELTDGLVAI
jgi:hypothetical protein